MLRPPWAAPLAKKLDRLGPSRRQPHTHRLPRQGAKAANPWLRRPARWRGQTGAQTRNGGFDRARDPTLAAQAHANRAGRVY